MSVVKINAIHVPEGMGPQLEQRFAGRAKMVEQFDGFEDFQLLRPVEGEERYFVYTRWASEEHFQAWLESREFGQGHAQAAADGDGGGHPGGHPGGDGEAPQRPPVSSSADLLAFEVVEHVVKG
jgi:heme-degrading monooxygenase HmoA